MIEMSVSMSSTIHEISRITMPTFARVFFLSLSSASEEDKVEVVKEDEPDARRARPVVTARW